MEKLNEYLQALLSTSGYELRLEPNRNPYVVCADGSSDLSPTPLQGTQISMMVFPLIPPEVKHDLPNKPEIQFIHPHNLGRFSFVVQKSPIGFNVSVRPLLGEPLPDTQLPPQTVESTKLPAAGGDYAVNASEEAASPAEGTPETSRENLAGSFENAYLPPIQSHNSSPANDSSDDEVVVVPSEEMHAAEEFVLESEPQPYQEVLSPVQVSTARIPEGNGQNTAVMRRRIESLFNKMAEVGASDLHLSVSMPPMVRKDGKMQPLECSESNLTPDVMKALLTSIMPERNCEEFARRNDTDFAYEITGLARFRCNVFTDRKGMGGVFRIIPTKILTAEQLGLSKAIMDLCSLSKGLVVVTGPTGSGKSTTLCAMVDAINKTREDHIITIEDPIEFVHENQKCLVNQREVHNHTDSFKDALRAALREDPDILLVGEMRDLETISIAIETAETGHLVFGTLHTTTAASTVDRIIDQFPADRQQQIRVMLSESLKGVIAQTLLPKKGGGRVAALEILIVTPAISNLIREGKTFQIPSAMQTGKAHGMVMLNDSLFDHVQKGTVEPRDAYLKAIDKNGFETMLTRGGFKI